MKGKIDNKGMLRIFRKSRELSAQCPYGKFISCGDYCALFGEPEKQYKRWAGTVENPIRDEKTATICLQLCHKQLVFEELIDERG